MQDGMAITKTAVTYLGRIKKPLVSIGWSDASVTFYFDDESWLKAQRYEEKLPDLRTWLNRGSMKNAVPVPPKFFDTVALLACFASDGKLYSTVNMLSTSEDMAQNRYEFQGAPVNLAFQINDLLAIQKLATSIDWRALPNAAMFYGQKTRGAVVWEDITDRLQAPVEPPKWGGESTTVHRCPECSASFDVLRYDKCPDCGA